MLVGGQDLPDELDVVRLCQADENDWQVARDAELPETLLPERVLRQGLPVGPKGCVGEEDAGPEPFGELGLFDGDAEMPLCHLRLRVGEGESASGDTVVVILLRALARGRLVAGDAGRERDAGKPPGREPQPGPEAQDRVEHGAGRPRESAPVHCLWVFGAAPAPQESHPVRLPLDLRLRRSVDGEDVKYDERRIVRAAGPTSRQESRILGDPLRLEEELPERGVGDVVGDGPQTHFDVARQLDLAGTVALVRQRDTPDLGVVPR